LSLLEFDQAVWDEAFLPLSMSVEENQTWVCEYSHRFPVDLLSEKLLFPASIQRGEIRCLGETLKERFQGKRAKEYQSLGWVFQEPWMIATLSIEDNILMPTLMQQLEISLPLKDTLQAWLTTLGLGAFRNLRPHLVSKRIQWLAAILRGFINEPRVVISFFDYLQLDNQEIQQCCRLMKEFQSRYRLGILLFVRSGNIPREFDEFPKGPGIVWRSSFSGKN
jgi:ABC-type ATPase involved in cell division